MRLSALVTIPVFYVVDALVNDILRTVTPPSLDALCAAIIAVREKFGGCFIVLILGLRSGVHACALGPGDIADLSLRYSALSEASRGDIAVRAKIVRADSDRHFIFLESVIEIVKDTSALVLKLNHVLTLLQSGDNSV